MHSYPVLLKRDDNSTLMVTFPDIPEAVTYGVDRQDALLRAQGALIAVIAARIDDHEDIPRPSKRRRVTNTVSLPPLVAVKVAIYRTMRERGISRAALARMLDQDPRQIERLLDVTHASRHDQLDKALAVLGKRLRVDIEDAA